MTASRQREGSLLYSAGVLDIQSPHLLSNCPPIGLQSGDCHTLVRGQDTRLHKQLPRTEYGSILGGGGETEYLGGLALGKIVLSTFGEDDIILEARRHEPGTVYIGKSLYLSIQYL